MPKNCNIMLEENDIEDIILKINNNIYLTYDTSHFFTCSGNVESLWQKFHNKATRWPIYSGRLSGFY